MSVKAGLAHYFSLELISILEFILCALILIRFFFAPSSNIEIMLFHTRKNLRRKLYIFIDFVVLIIHAVVFYFICNSFFPIPEKNYWFYLKQNEFTPFIWILFLLILNALWLIMVQRRIYIYEKRLIWRYCVWIFNNVGCSFLLLILFLFFRNKDWMLLLAYFNCCFDITFTAPDYLNQRGAGLVKNKFGLELWGHTIGEARQS